MRQNKGLSMIGLAARAGRASLAVLDTGFADEIRKYIEKEDLGDERRR